jgi:Cu/Ag efflux protein CusF
MKRFALLLAGLVVSSITLLPDSVQARNWLEKLHKGTYQVVSVDPMAKNITLKDDSGDTNTAPVLGKAASKLGDFSAGMKVMVTCRDSDEGKHEGIVDIQLVKEPADANAKSYHQATCTVVSVDVEGQTITLSDENGEEFTSVVMGHALDKLADLSYGSRVTITCQDNAKGDHEGIVDIEIVR